MIADIKKHKRPHHLIEYNEKKVAAGEAKLLVNHTNGSDADEVVKEMLIVNSTLKNEKDSIIHISLNPSFQDDITDEQFIEIADEYMERMGYGNNPYVVYKHTDRGEDKPHIHIVTTKKDYDDKIVDAHLDYKKSYEILRDMEVRYGWEQVEKGRYSEGKTYRVNRNEGPSKKDFIRSKVDEIVAERPDKERFIRKLLESNIVYEERRYGDKTGVVFALCDIEGNRLYSIPGSKLRSNYSYNFLHANLFIKSAKGKVIETRDPEKADAERIKRQRQYGMKNTIRHQIRRALSKGPDLELYIMRLYRAGIRVEVAYNRSGITGLRYYDPKGSGESFTGDQLGKPYRYSRISEKLSEEFYLPQHDLARVNQGHYFKPLSREDEEFYQHIAEYDFYRFEKHLFEYGVGEGFTRSDYKRLPKKFKDALALYWSGRDVDRLREYDEKRSQQLSTDSGVEKALKGLDSLFYHKDNILKGIRHNPLKKAKNKSITINKIKRK